MNLKHYINFLGIKPLKKFFLACLMLDNHAHSHAYMYNISFIKYDKKVDSILKRMNLGQW